MACRLQQYRWHERLYGTQAAAVRDGMNGYMPRYTPLYVAGPPWLQRVGRTQNSRHLAGQDPSVTMTQRGVDTR